MLAWKVRCEAGKHLVVQGQQCVACEIAEREARTVERTKRSQIRYSDCTVKVNEVEKPQPRRQAEFVRRYEWPAVTLELRSQLDRLDRRWEAARRVRDAADRLVAKQGIVEGLQALLGEGPAAEVVAVMKAKGFKPSSATMVAWDEAVGGGRANGHVGEAELVAAAKAKLEVEVVHDTKPIVKRTAKGSTVRVTVPRKWAHGQKKPSGFGAVTYTVAPWECWD